MNKAELMAPAGSMESLQAAILNGADSCFLGMGTNNMRVNAKNFTDEQYTEAITRLHDHGLKGYLTLNTIYYDKEYDRIQQALDVAATSKTDAVICWDPMVIQACRERGLNFHISTQASISNARAAKFYQDLGAKCVVLARECTLEDIVTVKRETDVKVECFIHGAMCVAISGRCFMSLDQCGHSANRGDCHQPCRYPFEVKGTQHPAEFQLNGQTVMSPKDLCAMPIIDLVLKAGVDILKIEGRARGPEYVAKTVKAYRQAIDAYYEGTLTTERKAAGEAELAKVFNRGFSNGFYLGRPMNAWAEDGNQATMKKELLGIVEKVYPKINVIEVKLQTRGISTGEQLLITGSRCGAYEFTLDSMQVEHQSIEQAEQGTIVGVKVADASNLRANDKVFRLYSIFDQ